MRITDGGLHIIQSSSSGHCWKECFGNESRLFHQRNKLAYGPLIQCADYRTWRQGRREYLRCVHADCFELDDADFESVFMAEFDRLREQETIYLWIGTGLFDQLLLPFLLGMGDRIGFDPPAVYLVQYELLPGGSPVQDTGILGPDEIAAYPAPTRVTPAMAAECHTAWGAVTAPEPGPLERFVESPGHAMPHLRPALRVLLERYPMRETGLPRSDWCLLRGVADCGPRAVRVIGHALAESFDTSDCLGDEYLFYRLRAMADERQPWPLVRLAGPPPGVLVSCREYSVTLTNFGRAVLAGEASAFPRRPLDDWIGGVHLSSADRNVWLVEGGSIRRAAATEF